MNGATVALFRDIHCWSGVGGPAPHKPLLILYALAQLQAGTTKIIYDNAFETRLKALIGRFSKGKPRPEYPFWYLQNDGIWRVTDGLGRPLKIKGKTPGRSDFLPVHAVGSFVPSVLEALQSGPDLVHEVAEIVLRHFPPTLHEDLLDDVGFLWTVLSVPRRDPAFRATVLRLYDHRCAVCGYDAKLNLSDLALEAAHIQWVAANGPSSPDNGLALCSIHHKALDVGAIGLEIHDQGPLVLVSQLLSGSPKVVAQFRRFSRKPLNPPQPGQLGPAAAYVAWHRKNIFREPAL